MSPSYKPPEKIEDIEEPAIFKKRKLHHLKIIKFKNMKEKANKQGSSFKCCDCHKEMKEKDQPNIILPCGHLICNSCKNGKERCPICDSKINKYQRIFFEEFCALCLENKPNTISLPCGHLCMCYECAMQNSANGYNCPMCNEPMTNFKFTFDDDTVQNHHFFKHKPKQMNKTKEMKKKQVIDNSNKKEEEKNYFNNENESDALNNHLQYTKSIEYYHINENADDLIYRSHSVSVYI